MSLPALLKEAEATDAGWKRRVRDLVNQITKRTMDNGPTGARPRNPETGTFYFDTALAKPVWWAGSGWVDATGMAA